MNTPSTAASPRLALHGISKRYASVIASDRIDLAVAAGEIHALVIERPRL
jgi:simple sugar transport system ATP-binding protein